MARGGARPGSGRPTAEGQPKRERMELRVTEWARAEIEAAVPDGDAVGPWIVAAALEKARRSG